MASLLAVAVATLCAVAAIALSFLLRKYSRAEHDFHKTKETPTRESRRDFDAKRVPQGYLLNKSLLYIYHQEWRKPGLTNEQEVELVVVIAHGVAEHSGRYEQVARRICREMPIPTVVVALDHQGHGRSEGNRQFVKEFVDFTDDVACLSNTVLSKYPNAKQCLLGHSMGALIAIRTLQRFPELFQALIISAPPLDIPMSALERNLAPLFADKLPMLPTRSVDVNKLCHDPVILDLYCNDPLVCTQGVTARLGFEILNAAHEALAYAGEICVPYLLLRGSDDEICLRPRMAEFHDKTSSADKSFTELEGLFHEIFLENQTATDMSLKFLNKCFTATMV